MVSSTVCRSSVELTAWETSPSARNSSTERISSDVRARNSLSSRAFSMAMTAWAAKFCTSAICLSANGRTSCRKMTMLPINTSSLSRSEEHTSELQSHLNLVCRLLLEKKKKKIKNYLIKKKKKKQNNNKK